MADTKHADFKTVYHRTDGATTIHAIDANHAVSAHPLEWKSEPWTDDEALEAEIKLDEQNKAKAAEETKPKGRDRAPAKKAAASSGAAAAS